MLSRVKFSVSIPGADRIHHLNEQDVRIVLSRLPFAVWRRLRAVHFNDRSRGARVLGYVNRGRREIALCALPPRMALTRALRRGQTPEQFGSKRGQKWPALAIRRFLLYDVFLHELGHLQLVDDRARSDRLKFARETLAEEFAVAWCNDSGRSPLLTPTRSTIHQPPWSSRLWVRQWRLGRNRRVRNRCTLLHRSRSKDTKMLDRRWIDGHIQPQDRGQGTA